MFRQTARYHKAILPEHKGNPLIEALNPKLSDKEIVNEFSHYPELDSEVRYNAPSTVREEYLSRISELRQPLYLYIDCFRAIERVIKAGYSTKNPFCPTTIQYLHYPIDERPDITPKSGNFVPKSEGLTLVGDSGLGKTCMLEQILNYLPQVIEHTEYEGREMPFKYQVVWLKVDCPTKSSVRELCEEILMCLDKATQNPLQTPPATTIPKLLRQIEQAIKSSFLGILVIDEMQNLEFSRTGGENNLLKFLQNMMNKLGVPLFFCANPPFDESLTRQLRNARRAESAGFFQMLPLRKNSVEWIDFVEEMWALQWTNIVTPLTEELSEEMYRLSVGNMDIACRIYRQAQRLIIGSGDERLSVPVLRDAYNIACGLSSRTSEILERRSSLTRSNNAKSFNKYSSTKQASPTISGDFNRPHHPEFEGELRALQTTKYLNDLGAHQYKLREISEETDIDKILKKYDLFCHDSLFNKG
jgi:hypothetical protein